MRSCQRASLTLPLRPQHAHVCNCIRVFEDMANLYILLEYCPNRVRACLNCLPNGLRVGQAECTARPALSPLLAPDAALPAAPQTLQDVLKKRRRVSEGEAQYYGWQILDGLSYIHAQGVLHRDIK